MTYEYARLHMQSRKADAAKHLRNALNALDEGDLCEAIIEAGVAHGTLIRADEWDATVKNMALIENLPVVAGYPHQPESEVYRADD